MNQSHKLPLVSVVMPVYNAERFVNRAIQSILDQTYKNIEFIIIENGSVDDSRFLIRKYAKLDRRIRVIENKNNIGISAALNQGIEDSKGIYIARMDADDWSREDRLSQQIDFLENNPDYGVVGSYYYEIDTGGDYRPRKQNPVDHDKIVNKMAWFNPIAHPTAVFRKGLGLYNLAYKYAQDYELWFRLRYTTRFYNIPRHFLIRTFEPNYAKMKEQELESYLIKKLYLNNDSTSLSSLIELKKSSILRYIPIKFREMIRRCRDAILV